MFYDQLMALCSQRGEKPTPLLKEIGVSPSYLYRWQKGSPVNSDVLFRLSQHFGVPTDYFFESEPIEYLPPDEDDANNKQNLYYLFRAHGELFCSALNGKDIFPLEIQIIAKYMGCNETYLCPNYPNIENKEKKICNTENEIIIGILSRAAGNDDFRYLQVQIGRIIISNLERVNIYKKDLIDLKLNKEKINNIYNREIYPSSCIPLNFYDCLKISDKYGVSFTYMFTGRE